MARDRLVAEAHDTAQGTPPRAPSSSPVNPVVSALFWDKRGCPVTPIWKDQAMSRLEPGMMENEAVQRWTCLDQSHSPQLQNVQTSKKDPLQGVKLLSSWVTCLDVTSALPCCPQGDTDSASSRPLTFSRTPSCWSRPSVTLCALCSPGPHPTDML